MYLIGYQLNKQKKEPIMSKKLAEMVRVYLASIQNVAMGSRHIIDARLQYENHILTTK